MPKTEYACACIGIQNCCNENCIRQWIMRGEEMPWLNDDDINVEFINIVKRIKEELKNEKYNSDCR